MKKTLTLSAMTIASLVSLTGCDSELATTLSQYISPELITTLLTSLLTAVLGGAI